MQAIDYMNLKRNKFVEKC